MKQTLKEEFEHIANKYANKLVEMYFTEDDNIRADFYWVGDEAGGILSVCDYYFFNFDDIRYIVDNNVPFDTWLEWYDYTLIVADFALASPNLKSWHHGCPRLSKEQLHNLKMNQ